MSTVWQLAHRLDCIDSLGSSDGCKLPICGKLRIVYSARALPLTSSVGFRLRLRFRGLTFRLIEIFSIHTLVVFFANIPTSTFFYKCPRGWDIETRAPRQSLPADIRPFRDYISPPPRHSAPLKDMIRIDGLNCPNSEPDIFNLTSELLCGYYVQKTCFVPLDNAELVSYVLARIKPPLDPSARGPRGVAAP